MRALFRWLVAALFVAVVVQVGLAGYGAFHAIHAAEKASISKKAIEDAFNAHAILGTLMVLLMLVLLIVAAAGRLDRRFLHWSGGLLVLGILQAILGAVSTSVPVVGFLHTLNALAIFASSALLAYRAWTEREPETVVRGPSPVL